ncbi:hypothetical protein MU582_00390 [Nocardioidaceae bacterium SCSIO 66511]|nr:hypothetical protein MU582_00390 [Nocardioidaceae bacterium SCSIO 66511]
MSWDETHRRWQAVREVIAQIDIDASGELPWRSEYAEIFGDRDGLVHALRYRWKLIVQAQLDPELSEDVLAETFRDIMVRNAGLLRVLDRYTEGVPYVGDAESMKGLAVVEAG